MHRSNDVLRYGNPTSLVAEPHAAWVWGLEKDDSPQKMQNVGVAASRIVSHTFI